VVDGAALEKQSPVIPERGFESHPLRQTSLKLRLVDPELLLRVVS
jgi:hypothetical protein